MTALLDRVPVDQITEARQEHSVRPGRILLTLVLGMFFVLGWLAGKLMILVTDCANSARIGWWRGKGLTAEQIAQRLSPAPVSG
jgi:hypothetical protein